MFGLLFWVLIITIYTKQRSEKHLEEKVPHVKYTYKHFKEGQN